MKVFVINKDGKPLMPCSPMVARLLLRDGKAKVKHKTPFTIKLLYQATDYTQSLTLGIDTGSSKIGSAAVNSKNEVIYMSEVEIRNDISDKMKARAKYRRNRRNRKTRYRKARWLNRSNSIKLDRFSPTMRSKIASHEKEIRFVKGILPITDLVIETGTFDPHAMKNPEVLVNKTLYQRGQNYQFANTKAFVLSRDNYTCQYCKGKCKDKHLEVHHKIYRSNGGSDDSENLITVSETCHKRIHRENIVIKGGKLKGQLNHATQMNSIRIQLLRNHPEATETFGYITKEDRQSLSLPKEHFIDAVVIASRGAEVTFKTKYILYKKCISDGDYQQTKGVRSEKAIPTGKVQGFRKFDVVRYHGKEYIIKGRMSSGYAKLMDISGNTIDLKPIPKLNLFERTQARKSWIMIEQTIQSIY